MHSVLRAVGQHASHIAWQTRNSGSSSWLMLSLGGRAELLHARRFSDRPKEGFLSRWLGGDQAKEDSSDAASKGSIVPASSGPPFQELLALPLARRPLFPAMSMPVHVKDRELINALLEMKKAGAQPYLATFLLRDPAPTTDADSDAADSAHSESDASSNATSLESGAEHDAPPITAANIDDRMYKIGTFAQVWSLTPNADGSATLMLNGHRRLERTGVALSSPLLKVTVRHLRDHKYLAEDDEVKASHLQLMTSLKDLLAAHSMYREMFLTMSGAMHDRLHDLSCLADVAAALTSASKESLQGVLEQLNVIARAEETMRLLKKEESVITLQTEISQRVEEKVDKDRRRFLLMEQLKYIKKELGIEKDDTSSVVERCAARLTTVDHRHHHGHHHRFQQKLADFGDRIPPDARKVIDEELSKLSNLEPSSAEFNVTRNYLDWLTSVPWGRYLDENANIDVAQHVLDEDHWGLEDVKERILEFIAVGQLRGTTAGKIVCLVGPPGVGKTSIGKSIARALGRDYYRFSVGGLRDVAEIKGHRRTYVGAMPGKMVQCLKSCGSANPLVLIDEIDKIGQGGYQGDPASALLELLDPEQNDAFMDHYLDVPVDLSKVLFMCTANVLDTIPGPLLDRMEVIRLSGYIFDEKVAIARKYLEPQAMSAAGVPAGSCELTDAGMTRLIDAYCREAGVRNLKKLLEKVYRKVALKLVRQGHLSPAPTHEDPASDNVPADNAPTTSHGASTTAAGGAPVTVIDEATLVDYVGQPPFTNDRLYERTPPGVVMGLAWTAMGGSTLYIEAASVPSQQQGKEGKGGSMRATGQLGDVMKESASIAHTYARHMLHDIAPGNAFLDTADVHVHVPAGATPKDGPSAGCTIVTALLSLALGRPVRQDLAMTGEVTLTGRVLPVGGIKEKLLAAKRAGVKEVIFPAGNRPDYEELSDNVKQGVTPHFVEQYRDVYEVALGDAPQGEPTKQ